MSAKTRVYDSQEVADRTGRVRVTVIKLAERYKKRKQPIGEQKSGVWLFTDKDIDRINAIPKRGGRPVSTGSGLKRKRKERVEATTEGAAAPVS